MDQIIEDGFIRLTGMIEELGEKNRQLEAEIRSDLGRFLAKMATLASPLVGKLGNQFMQKSKQDARGEFYDSVYYTEKMIILGRAEDPAPYRPDDMTKTVVKQYCVLTDTGVIGELMYSDDGFIIDSYVNELTPEEAIDLYGPELIYMLYHALNEYGNLELELLQALEKTIAFIQEKEE